MKLIKFSDYAPNDLNQVAARAMKVAADAITESTGGEVFLAMVVSDGVSSIVASNLFHGGCIRELLEAGAQQMPSADEAMPVTMVNQEPITKPPYLPE